MAQLAMSRMLGAADYGVVRTVEAVLATLIVAGGLGMPTLAVRAVAHVQVPEERARLTGSILGISLMVSLVVTFAAMAGSYFLKGESRQYLQEMAWIVPITVVSRTGVNYFQGIRQFKRISVVMFGMSLLSLIVVLAFVRYGGLNGWVAGRLAGEVAMLLTLAWMLRGNVTFRGRLPNAYPVKRLAKLGIAIMAGLLFRSMIDTLPLILMNRLDLPNEASGVIGFCFLMMSAASLFVGVVYSVVLPELSSASDDPARLHYLFQKTMRITMTAGVVLTAILLGLGPVARWILPASYSSVGVLLPVVALGFLPRVMSTGYSTLALVSDRPGLTTVCLFAGVTVGVPAYLLGIRQGGVLGAAVVSLAIDLFLLACLTVMTHQLRSAPTSEEVS